MTRLALCYLSDQKKNQYHNKRARHEGPAVLACDGVLSVSNKLHSAEVLGPSWPDLLPALFLYNNILYLCTAWDAKAFAQALGKTEPGIDTTCENLTRNGYTFTTLLLEAKLFSSAEVWLSLVWLPEKESLLIEVLHLNDCYPCRKKKKE